MADRRQQGPAQLVGPHHRVGPAGLGGQFLLTDQSGGLASHHRQHPAVTRGQLSAGHQHPEFVVADIDRGVRQIYRGAGIFTDRGDDFRRRGAVRDADQAHRPLRVGLANPLQQGVQVGAA